MFLDLVHSMKRTVEIHSLWDWDYGLWILYTQFNACMKLLPTLSA